MGRFNTVDDFWKYVDKKSDDECWIWKGGTKNGCGVFNYHKKQHLAYKFSYFISTGYLPDFTDRILHTCTNKSCVNPKHVYLRENPRKHAIDRTVKKCTAVTDFEYSFELDCGHSVKRTYTKKRLKMPKHLICPQCWHKNHDKNGNPI